jgi:hypothetical protein
MFVTLPTDESTMLFVHISTKLRPDPLTVPLVLGFAKRLPVPALSD